MSVHWSDPWLTVYQGDCRAVLRSMEPESVHCVVTSPPYWGLRDYGTAGQLGLESTPEEYVANMVDVFREVRRVLRSDGTVWLNLGDSYSGSGPSGAAYQSETTKRRAAGDGTDGAFRVSKRLGERGLTYAEKKPVPAPGLKPKDLAGIPWRVAFALQADGWYLRSDIIWSKPNPMPESVTDRPTKSHEYLFLLSKSPRYFYDADAVREAHTSHPERIGRDATPRGTYLSDARALGQPQQSERMPEGGRNLRSVWTIATQPYPGQHFAVFPRKLVEPCIKAGTSERGVCPECGAPWVRETLHVAGDAEAQDRPKRTAGMDSRTSTLSLSGNGSAEWAKRGSRRETTGWRPSCRHDADPIPATVLDPFAGSGTTGMVAQALGRRAVLVDLNGDYLVQAMARNAQMPLGAA